MNWKQAVMYGAFGGAAVMVLRGQRHVGLALAGVGLVFMAAEHPEHFEQLWERAPEYLERGSQIVGVISRIKQRLEEEGAKAIPGAWHEAVGESY